MVQTTEQIEKHIEQTHENLSSNLHELELKVRAVTDWKQQFQSNPMTMLGVAFGGGIALAAMLRGGKSRGRKERIYSNQTSTYTPNTESLQGKAMDTFDNIKGALMGVAAARLTDFVDELIPGFNEHFQRTGEKSKAA